MIHIHNGDMVAMLVPRAGVPGEHLSFRESLVSGPVVPGPDWIETRARALAAGHQVDLLRVRTDLVEQEQALAAAPSQGEVVLWFEHDLYCLVHLIYLLDRFADARVSLVWCPKPLTENEERDIYLLFESRAAATPSMIAAAREVWRAYTSDDAVSLNRWIERDTPDFPFLRDGLKLHASRFPSTRNGLGTIEQRALELIAGGAADFLTLFPQVDPAPPRFGFGDTEVRRHLRQMATCAVPLITISGEAPKEMLAITPAGENVLRGEVDDVAINDPDRWLGGAHLTKENLWRWDGTRLSRSAGS